MLEVSRSKDNGYLLKVEEFMKSSFSDSLRKILSVFTTDLYIKQMFEDSHSIIYIPDRICEIIKEHLTDDRERLINELYKNQISQNSFINEKTDFLITFKNFLENIFRDIVQLKIQFHEDISLVRDHVISLVNAACARSFESSVNEDQFLQRIAECHKLFNNTIPTIRKRYELEIAAKDKEIARLDGQIKNQKKNIFRLTRQKNKAEDSMTTVKNTLSQVQTENDILKENQRQRQLFEGRTNVLEKELVEKNNKIDDFLSEIQSSSSIESSSKVLISKLKMDLRKSEHENRELKKKLQKTEIEMEKVGNDQKMSNADQQLLKSQLTQLELAVKERDDLYEKYKTANSLNYQLKSKVAYLKKWNSDMKSEMNILKRELADVTGQKYNSDQLSSEMSQIKEEFSSVEQENNSKDFQLNEISINFSSCQRKLKETDQKLKDSESTVIEQTDQIKFLRNKIESLENENASIKKEKTYIINELNKIKKENEIKSANEITLIEKLKISSDLNEEVAKEKEKISKELTESKETINQLNEKAENIKNSLKKKEKDIEKMQHNESFFENEKANLNKELDRSLSELAKLRETVSSAERKSRKISQQLTDANSNNKKLNEKINELTEKFQLLSDSNKNLESENQQLKTEMSSKKSELGGYSETVKKLKDKNKQLNDQIAIKEKKITSLINDKNRQSMELEKNERQLSNEMVQIKEDNSKLSQKVTNLQHEKEEIVKQLKESKWKGEELQERLAAFVNNSKTDSELHNNEINDYKKEIENKQISLQNVQKMLNDFQSKIRQIERKTGTKNVNELPKIIDDLKEKNSILDRKISSIKAAFNIPNNADFIDYVSKVKTNYETMSDRENKLKSIFLKNKNYPKSSQNLRSTASDFIHTSEDDIKTRKNSEYLSKSQDFGSDNKNILHLQKDDIPDLKLKNKIGNDLLSEIMKMKSENENQDRIFKRLMTFFEINDDDSALSGEQSSPLFKKCKDLKLRLNELENHESILHELLKQNKMQESFNGSNLENLEKEFDFQDFINFLTELINEKNELCGINDIFNNVFGNDETNNKNDRKGILSKMKLIISSLIKILDIPAIINSASKINFSKLNEANLIIEEVSNLKQFFKDIQRTTSMNEKDGILKDVSLVYQIIASLQNITETKEKEKIAQKVIKMKQIISNLSDITHTKIDFGKLCDGGENESLNKGNSLINDVSRMKQTISKLNSVFNPNSTSKPSKLEEELINEILKVKNNNDQMMNSLSNSGLLSNSNKNRDPIRELINISNELQEAKKRVPSKLLNKNNNDICGAIDDLNKRNDVLSEVENQFFLDNDFKNPNNAFSSNKDMNLKERIVLLKDNFKEALSILNTVFCIISGISSFSISFPISSSLKTKLIDSVQDFRKKRDLERLEIDRFLTYSKSQGYIGNGSLIKVNQFLIEGAVEKEREKALQKMHEELNEVRDLATKERDLFETQKRKLTMKIGELRASIAQIQGKATQREEEVSDEIEQMKINERKATLALETEKRIKEELLRIASGQIADFDFLSSRLSVSEMSLIKKHQK